MIIKIKKRILTLILFIFLASAAIVYAPSTTIVRNFKVELAIANQNPKINISNVTGFAVDPVAGGNTVVFLQINISDPDGAGNINASTLVVNFTLGDNRGAATVGEYYDNVSAVSTSEFGTCRNFSESGTVVIVNCSVIIPYYANASSNWVINVSVKDILGGSATNDTLRFTVNTVSGLSLPYTFVNFSNVNVGQQNARAYPHLLMNNTGNDDFNRVNMTAAALVGTTVTTENIAVTNFGVNLTNSSTNQRFSFPSDGTINLRNPVNGSNASLYHGHTSAFSSQRDKGNISAFIWVNIPSSGLSGQLYNATWNVTVIS